MLFDFTKNRTVETLETVPVNCQAFYEEMQGKEEADPVEYKLRTDAQTVAAVAVITGQNKALGKVRDEVTAAKAAKGVDLSALSTYGDSVDSIEADRKARDEDTE